MEIKKNKKYSVLTENGFKKYDSIKKTLTNLTLKIEFSDGSGLECTDKHLIKRQDKFVYAKDLVVGDIISNLVITKILTSREEKFVYDLINVEDGHEYITNNVTSHNCAFVENWEDFYRSVYPTISSGRNTKIVFTSTPRGINHYYKLWTDAINGNNSFVPIKVTWSDVPGRDLKWKEDTIANTSMEAFIQEHEAEFIGSSGTLIDGWKLKELAEWIPLKSTKYAKVYEEPEKDSEYVIVADVSRGKGIDNSSISVIKISSLPYKVVATYYCDNISPDMFADVIYQSHKKYNDGVVLVENNDAGCETLRVLNDTYECESILGTIAGTMSGDRKRISINGGQGFELGIRTTKSTKSIGCSRLKTLLENNTLLLGDKNMIDELNRFSRKGNSYEAEKGSHDDLVMNLVSFAWLTTQELFVDLTHIDTRLRIKEKIQNKLDEDLMPFMVISDSSSDDTFGTMEAMLLGYSVQMPDYTEYHDIVGFPEDDNENIFAIP